ncbi:MAG TPA: T9SS type A sorting domain-containing protein [Ignavibacteriales bacterium]|nr:T9SS type A sorting domain-containing protein [Ignavibacteriales bacterium]
MLIKVVDSEGDIKDSSDATFIYNYLRIVSPNNGEIFRQGTPVNIQWTSNLNPVTLEYSTDNGLNWNLIVSGKNGTTHTWVTPTNLLSNNIIIKVKDDNNNLINDTTDNRIKVIEFKITQPNGLETWVGNSVQKIKVLHKLLPSSLINLYYTTNNGTNWNTIATNISANGDSTIYNWLVPKISSNNVKVRIVDATRSNIADTSDNVFTITNPQVTVISPNGGEVLPINKPTTITWTKSVDVANVNVYTRLENKRWYRPIVSGFGGTSISWTPDTAGNYRIIVCDAANPSSVIDSSDAFVSVYKLNITSPNGGENWIEGKRYNITWNASINLTNVNIDYSTNGGSNWISLVNNIPASSGSYSWLIPSGITGTNTKIRVRSSNYGNIIKDSSANSFTIHKIRLLSPNLASDGFVIGKQMNISWDVSNSTIPNIKISYLTPQTSGIISGSFATTTNSGYFSVPNVSSDSVKIIISDVLNPNIADTSDNYFKIAQLVVTSPVGGENWQINRRRLITWNNSSNVNFINLEYTLNGITWFTIANNVNASLGSYNWLVPDVLSSTNALVRITDNNNVNIKDTSDNVFAIFRFDITSPNGGVKIAAGKKYNITWNAQNVSLPMQLQYTFDGNNWNNIAGVNSTDQSYLWDVPADTSTSNLKIRIIDGMSSFGDTSDAANSIAYSKILNPVLTSNWQTGKTYPIRLQLSPNVNFINLLYRIGNNTPVSIANNIARTSEYQWSVPLTLVSNDIRIIVQDANATTTIADTSNIFNTRRLNLTSFTGGEKVIAGKTYKITWIAQNLGNIKIEFSKDGGLNWATVTGGGNINSALGEFDWVVNNEVGSQNKIRLVSLDYGNVRDSSATNFTISELKITNPTAASNFKGGTTQTISWTSSIDINKVNIYYSTNNGTNWIVIKSNHDYVGTSANYNWIVPNVTSSQCKVKIEDAQNPGNYDTSATFSIYTPTITVLTPNTNIRLLATKTYAITWSKQYVNNVKLEYSTNGGSSWKLIASPLAGTSYNWTIPNDTTNNAKIKITDLSDTTIYDMSDVSFTISSINFVSPLGGEIVQINKPFNIRWRSAYIDKVRIDYTLDGTNWIQIINNYDANVGSYAWNVTNYSTTLKFRIYDAVNTNNFIESNSITSANLVITQPIGGEIYQSGNNIKIKWTSQNISNVKLEYSLENGAEGTWNTIVNSVSAAVGTTGYDWLVDTSISTRRCLIRISEVDNPNVNATNNSVFKIGNIVVLSPNGNEVRQNQQADTIRWYNKPSTSSVKLYYSTNNGGNWTLITTVSTNPYGGSYIWTPNISNPTTNMLIKVEDAEGVIKDSSNTTYTMVNLVLVSPNGGNYWQAGTIQKIKWNATNLGNISIRYTTNDGVNWNNVVSNIASTLGEYDWAIPTYISSKDCRIKLISVSDSNRIYSISANKFKIGKVTLTTFTGNEKVKVGTSHTIRWTRSSSIDFVNLYYFDGSNWQTIATNVDASLNKYVWTIPNTPTVNARIRISDANSNLNIKDSSGTTFRISRIYVLQPNGNENYRAGLVYPINWNVSSDITNLKLEYTTDDGINWYTITSNTNAATGTYNWRVPDTASTGYRIRISDVTFSSEIADTSDNIFTVKRLNLITPDASTNWLANTTQQIKWNTVGVSQIILQYTTNNGSTWNNITTNPISASTGQYNWLTPNISSTNVKVRIYDYSVPNISDTSASFTIYKPVISLNSPNGGESWAVGSTKNITWNSAYVTRLKIEYSTDGGQNYILINDNVNPTTGIFNWVVPNTPTKFAKIRLTDYNNSGVIDTSDSYFRIKTLQLVKPNGAEYYQVLRTKPIQWNAGGIDNIRIDYSTNNGANWSNLTTINAESGIYNWNITPAFATTNNYKIRITDIDDISITDESDNTFSVRNLRLLKPVGNEAYMYDSLVNIQWTASVNIQNVKLQYRISDASSWVDITGASANLGVYNSWKAPLSASNFYKVRIIDSVSNEVYDSTAAYFKVGNINITTNLTGTSIQVGKELTINWTNTNNINTVKIELSTNGGSGWSTLTSNYVTGANGGSYTFTVPNNVTNNAIIKVSDQNNSNIYSQTASFTINNLTITKPITPESWKVASTQQIKWTSYNISNVNIYISTNNGANWLLIDNNVTSNNGNNVYNWVVANYASNQCLIKITDAVDENIASTISPNNFKIGDISVTSPTAGAKWQAGINKRIQWTNTTNITNVNIEYSLNGTTWLPIATNIPASTGYYDWKVVDNPSTTVQIRVTDAQGININSVSPVFTIVKIKMDYPNGNEFIAANSNVIVKWQSSNIVNVSLDYSTNGGSNWYSLASNQPAGMLQVNWTVPNLLTTANNCLIRIYDSSDPTIVDTTDNPFTIVVPKITVLKPDNSSYWQAGKIKKIQWTSEFINDVKIEFSSNDGNSWVTVISSIPANTNEYNWMIPSVPSDKYKIRISDVNNSALWDTSRVFTVSLLNIVSPNGGENIKVGTVLPIVFNAYYTGNVKIQYSTNNGNTWANDVVSTLGITNGSNTYNWTVPNIPYDNIKLRIYAISDTSINDYTDGSFRVANIQVVVPNDSVIWQAGTIKTLQWIKSSNIGNVNIDYSTDNGLTWHIVATNTSATSGVWLVPETPTDKALIRVSDATNPSMYDVSDKNFTIAQLKILAPNGGERIKALSNYTIRWQNAFTSNKVIIEYSTNSGNSWNLITNNASVSSKQYNWNVPDIISNTFRIKISDSLNTYIYDVSDSNFTIYKPEITLLTFNSGKYQAGKTYPIRWNSQNVANVTIQYSLNNGNNWHNIITNYPAVNGIYNWTIPSDSASVNARIRVVDYSDNNYYGMSTNAFTIAQIRLLSPIGGEQLQIDKFSDIRWYAQNVANVRIELSTDNGINWQSINNLSSVNGNNLFSWRVENKPSNVCKIRVRDLNYPEIKDSTAGIFRISNVQLLSPNGNERWQENKTYRIEWAASSNVNNVVLEYSTNSGNNWNIIQSVYPANVGYYNWNIPLNTSSNKCQIRIKDYDANSVFDTTDAKFTIVNLRLITPNGGEVWQANSTQRIRWQANLVGNIKLEYTTSFGNNWTTIVDNYPVDSNYFDWNIPLAALSDNAQIRISEYNNASIFDTCDNRFKIFIPEVKVISPNGNENLLVGKTYQILWNAKYINNVKIEYTTDNGGSWSTIATVPASNGLYNWLIPNYPSRNVKIKISDANNPFFFDDSDQRFNIVNIIIYSPNGGENWQARTTKQIKWKTYSIDNIALHYSTDNGTTWLPIGTANALLDTTYSWIVPNIPTPEARIRIRMANDTTVFVTSASTFTISNIELTNFVGGESAKIGKTYNIRWQSYYISNVKIEYSTNNGASWTPIVNSVPANIGLYPWVVPNIVSNNYLIKVSSTADYTIADSSKLPFRVANITLNNPRGTEVWQVGTVKTLSWTKTNNVSRIKLEFSSNNGGNWTTIISNSTLDSVFNWTVPNVLSDSCRIRVADMNSDEISDISGMFTIANVKFVRPTIGTVFQANKSAIIQWNSKNIQNFLLEYTTNNGTNWITISNNIPYYPDTLVWNVPNIVTNNLKLRISDVLHPEILDTTKTAVTVSKLQLLSLTGGENIQAGRQYTILWADSLINNVKIEYSTDNGSTWRLISSSVPAANKSYIWNIPNTPSINCRIRISDVFNPNVYDISGQVFTISNLTLDNPNGGEKVQALNVRQVFYTKSSNISSLKIEFSTDNGQTWNLVINSTADSVYNWNVPNTPSNLCRLRISDANNPQIYDISDTTFSIYYLRLLAPNGDVKQIGTQTTIRWEYSNNISRVSLYYTTNAGTNWIEIKRNIPADTNGSSYLWIIPNTPTQNALVRVAMANNFDIYDDSDSLLTLSTIKIIFPNGNNHLQVHRRYNIRWQAGYVKYINIDYSVNGGSTWMNIVSNYPADSSKFVWFVNDTVATNALLRIQNSADNSIYDISDFTFRISKLNLITPSGNEKWLNNTTKRITWDCSNDIKQVRIFYSYDNGLTWIKIADSVDATRKFYDWNIGNLSDIHKTKFMKIKLVDSTYNYSQTVYAQNDIPFTICDVTVYSPRANNYLQVGKLTSLSYYAKNIDRIRIEYRVSPNSAWNTIDTGVVTSSGKYNWVLPDDSSLVSNTFQFKLTDMSSDSIYILTEPYQIVKSIKVLSPNGGNQEILRIGSAYPIKWLGSANVSRVRIELHGVQLNPIILATVNNLPGVINTYSWTIQNTPSKIARIVIRDVDVTTIADSSDRVFTLAPFPKLEKLAAIQKDTVMFKFNGNNFEDMVLDTLYYTTLPNASEWIPTNNYNAPSTFISSGKDIIIKWYAYKDIGQFEKADMSVRFIFKSSTTRYEIQIDSVGFDNVAPQLPNIKFSYKKWDKQTIYWDSVKNDISKPIKYRVDVAIDPNFDTLIYNGKFTTLTALTIDKLYNNRIYYVRLQAVDYLNNFSNYIVDSVFTPLPCDYDSNSVIDAVDLLRFRNAWNNNSIADADFAPFEGSLPTVRIVGDRKLDAQDLFLFIKMWNLTQNNFILPKKNYNFVANDDVERIEQTITSKSKIVLPLKFEQERDAVSITLNYNPKYLKIDSVYIGKNKDNYFNLVYIDTIKGRLRIDATSFGGTIKLDDCKLNLVVNSKYDSKLFKDSLIINYSGYNKDATEKINKKLLLSIEQVPETFKLEQNYPNPFNPVTTIKYQLPVKSNVEIKIYNILGQEIATLINQEQNAGYHTVIFDANQYRGGLASGVYFYRIVAGKFVQTKKMLLIK